MSGVLSVAKSLDSFECRSTLDVDGKEYVYYSLPKAEANGLEGVSKLPFSMKVLLENLLRNEDGRSVTKDDILAVAKWLNDKGTAGAESKRKKDQKHNKYADQIGRGSRR